MDWFAPDYLLYGSMITYLAAAIAAIVFYKHPQYCTLSAQAGCILASALGAVSAVRLLLSGQEKIILHPFESAIPFVSVSMTMDALSAFFILILSLWCIP